MLDKSTIERLARDAGFVRTKMHRALEQFAELVEAAVREEMAKQEPVAWTFTGSNRLMDEYEANLEAKRCGGTTRAFPLYAAPVQERHE